MYRIGMFSQMAKVTVKALRYYDEMGLLKPERVDPDTGYRYYTTEQLIPLQRIVALRQAGLSVEDTAAVLAGVDGAAILRARREELHWELAGVQGRLSCLESMLKREDFIMDYQAVLREVPGYTVYYKEGVIPNFAALTEFILGSGEECRAANPGIRCVEPDYCFVSYLDQEFRHENVHLLYAQAVTAAGQESGSIKFRTLEPVQAVCVYHRGAYERLGEAYAFAMNWLKENGYELSEQPRECYIDGVWNKENPERWLTELQFPVKKR